MSKIDACPNRDDCANDTNMLSSDQNSGAAQRPAYRADEAEISKAQNWGGARPNSGGARPGAGRKPKKPEFPPVAPIGPRWFVVQSHPGAEQCAVMEIARKAYKAYLPQTAILVRDLVLRSVFHKRLVPMFSGYLFAHFDRDRDPWAPILECSGVRQILRSSDNRPMPVLNFDVDALRENDAERLDLSSVTLPPHPIGSRVKFETGAMFGHVGTCIACDGITTAAEIAIFGRLVRMQMPRADVSLATD